MLVVFALTNTRNYVFGKWFLVCLVSDVLQRHYKSFDHNLRSGAILYATKKLNSFSTIYQGISSVAPIPSLVELIMSGEKFF